MRYSPPENHPESGCHDGGGRTMQSTAALSRGPSGPAQARLLGDSLAVELSALTRAALVRIQVPQPVPQENPAKSVSYRARRRSVSHGCIPEVYHKHRLWRASRRYGAPTEGTASLVKYEPAPPDRKRHLPLPPPPSRPAQ